MTQPEQLSMFLQGDDLPLFSGTAPQAQAQAQTFRPETVAGRQGTWAECPVCLDTKLVMSRPCTCEAGDALKRERAGSRVAMGLPVDGKQPNP